MVCLLGFGVLARWCEVGLGGFSGVLYGGLVVRVWWGLVGGFCGWFRWWFACSG